MKQAVLCALLTLPLLAGCTKAKRSDAAKPTDSGLIPGNPVFNFGQYRLEALGYQKQEFAFPGTATRYKGAAALGEDGRWTVQRSPQSPPSPCSPA